MSVQISTATANPFEAAFLKRIKAGNDGGAHEFASELLAQIATEEERGTKAIELLSKLPQQRFLDFKQTWDLLLSAALVGWVSVSPHASKSEVPFRDFLAGWWGTLSRSKT